MRAFGLLIVAWTAAADAAPCKQGDFKACEEACDEDKDDGTSCIRVASMWLGKDKGAPSIDEHKAFLAYTLGCGSKNGASCAFAGLMAEQGKGTKDGKPDGRSAVTWYSEGCDLKHVGSCQQLGMIYHDGLYGYHNAVKAAAAYKTACTAHEQGACTTLALMELHGDGIPSTPAKGIAGLEAACKAKYAPACTEAGIAYAKGEAHGKAEPTKAKAMFTRACKMKKQPDPRACDYLLKPI